VWLVNVSWPDWHGIVWLVNVSWPY
jgi:hypothetical protein